MSNTLNENNSQSTLNATSTETQGQVQVQLTQPNQVQPNNIEVQLTELRNLIQTQQATIASLNERIINTPAEPEPVIDISGIFIK